MRTNAHSILHGGREIFFQCVYAFRETCLHALHIAGKSVHSLLESVHSLLESAHSLLESSDLQEHFPLHSLNVGNDVPESDALLATCGSTLLVHVGEAYS